MIFLLCLLPLWCVFLEGIFDYLSSHVLASISINSIFLSLPLFPIFFHCPFSLCCFSCCVLLFVFQFLSLPFISFYICCFLLSLPLFLLSTFFFCLCLSFSLSVRLAVCLCVRLSVTDCQCGCLLPLCFSVSLSLSLNLLIPSYHLLIANRSCMISYGPQPICPWCIGVLRKVEKFFTHTRQDIFFMYMPHVLIKSITYYNYAHCVETGVHPSLWKPRWSISKLFWASVGLVCSALTST